jgi:hypothetical protein
MAHSLEGNRSLRRGRRDFLIPCKVMPMQAAVENSVTRTLALALSTIGSLRQLAEYLGASEEEIAQWLKGRGKPPTRIYMKALDLVASGPFSRKL